MNKEDWINHIYSDYEDGTGRELSKVLSKHLLEDTTIIQNAYKEICGYIAFNMDISVRYWCKIEQKYISVYSENVNGIDLKKWEITSWMNQIQYYPDTKLDDSYLTHVINIFKEEERINYGEDLSEDEINRKSIYGSGYNYLFAQLLDGHIYQ
jgi:hypothetical protein